MVAVNSAANGINKIPIGGKMYTVTMFDSGFPLRSDEVTFCLNNERISDFVKDYVQVLESSYKDLEIKNRDLSALYDSAITSLTAAKTRHTDDIEHIGSALIAEAEERGWCSQYDEFINKVNRILHIELETRERTYVVEVTARVSMQVEVEASSLNQAIESARDSVNYLDGRSYEEVSVTNIDIEDVSAEVS